MALSVTLRGVRVGADGHVRAELTNGSGREFRDVAHAKAFVQDLDGQSDFVLALILLWVLRHDPNATSLPSFDGKTFTLDPASATGAYLTVT